MVEYTYVSLSYKEFSRFPAKNDLVVDLLVVLVSDLFVSTEQDVTYQTTVYEPGMTAWNIRLTG